MMGDIYISIHAPREGGDHVARGDNVKFGISIHAPREGGDDSEFAELTTDDDFNPRPPRGGRLCFSAVYPDT